MAPPKYGDLGKQASDVFGKGYHFGLLKLDVGSYDRKFIHFDSFYFAFRLRPRQQLESSFPQEAALTSTPARCPET